MSRAVQVLRRGDKTSGHECAPGCPSSTTPDDLVRTASCFLNRLTDAEDTIRRATERNLEFTNFLLVRYFLAS